MPVTAPVAETLAIPTAEEDHVPPATDELNADVAASQMDEGPEMTPAAG